MGRGLHTLITADELLVVITTAELLSGASNYDLLMSAEKEMYSLPACLLSWELPPVA